ncbi:MAG TPA: GNAT family protein [Oscillospiraceae bacterium]|nr:GNAT family protein [Oscillospiraceae bacterium]HPF56274.1 GNAT family protein [Clostridiales bacterium]HPK35360.1 GNAT family protein [Oscillospiraceae bacterium]HPR76809.1 GNAT family protein [Oscillospiraceae bacterium]
METQRLIIRRFRPEDGADLFDYLSREEVVRFEPYGVVSREQAERAAARRAEDETFWAVCKKEKDGGKLIGNIYMAKQEFDTWELGYVFNSDFWGKGYAYETAKALMNSVFINQGAHRIIAKCNPKNERSWKLLERLGMRREGYLRQCVWFKKDQNGNPLWQDTYEYGILAEEWERLADITQSCPSCE